MNEKRLTEIISKYKETLHKKIEERKREMQHDSTEHYLMYHALGFSDEEGYQIDLKKILENMDLDSVFKEAEAENHMVHGDYNYHNLLVCQEGMAVTGFEHAHRDVQMEDLYYFLRKCMEKHHYDERLGYRMMRAYDSVNNLGKKERDYLAIRLAYPEKFWKITNSYYHSGKAWIPAKNVEKLSLSVAQTEEKKRFLRNLFAFQI